VPVQPSSNKTDRWAVNLKVKQLSQEYLLKVIIDGVPTADLMNNISTK
jgi:hypothetical protein